MTFTVKPGSDGAYIQVTHIGDMDLADMEAGRAAAAAVMKAHLCKRLLVDVLDAVPNASTTELFNFASSHAQHFPESVKLAIIERVPLEKTRFVENVSVNRGVNVRSFGDRAGALAWLLADIA